MITIQITGGIGNQMFQYAAGRSLAIKNGTELFLDTLSLQHGIKLSKQYSFREYSLGVFNIDAKITFLSKYSKGIHFNNATYLLHRVCGKLMRCLFPSGFFVEENPFLFDPRFFNQKDGVYISGYFQSAKYFEEIKEIILSDFSLRLPLSREAHEWGIKIRGFEKSVSMHIRRGDYVNNPNHFLQPMEYYKEALNTIERILGTDMVLFIFSDDLYWVKENVKFKNTFFFVEGKGIRDYEELYLMSICKNNIISNSSFSWWAAWLNRDLNKTVIAPQKWSAGSESNNQDIYPEGWIKI